MELPEETAGSINRERTNIVEISRRGNADRSDDAWTGLVAERVRIVNTSPFDYRVSLNSHILIQHDRGTRYDGETIIEGFAKSALKDPSKRLTFVPIGYKFSGWIKPRELPRSTYFAIDADSLFFDPDIRGPEIEFVPRLLFKDRTFFETATKLTEQIGNSASRAYGDALSIVLLHELVRGNNPAAVSSGRRFELAKWQQKRVLDYIFANPGADISLVDLAKVAKLSPFHFARAFKQSFDLPPHRYLMHHRIDLAKKLLQDPHRSIAEIANLVGYTDATSFSTAFRRLVGTTPTAYRRAIE